MSESNLDAAKVKQEEGHKAEAPVSLSLSRIVQFSMLMNVLLVTGLVVMGMAFSALLPLKEEVVRHIALDKDSKDFVYELMPIDTIKGQEALAEYFIRQYITLRHTKDEVEHVRRAKTLVSMSSDPVWKDLQAWATSPKNTVYHDPNIKRRVEILRASPLPMSGDDRGYDVDFVTIDTSDTSPGEEVKTEWNVKLLYDFYPQKLHKEADGSILNPSGLKIKEYTLSQRRTF